MTVWNDNAKRFATSYAEHVEKTLDDAIAKNLQVARDRRRWFDPENRSSPAEVAYWMAKRLEKAITETPWNAS